MQLLGSRYIDIKKISDYLPLHTKYIWNNYSGDTSLSIHPHHPKYTQVTSEQQLLNPSQRHSLEFQQRHPLYRIEGNFQSVRYETSDQCENYKRYSKGKARCKR